MLKVREASSNSQPSTTDEVAVSARNLGKMYQLYDRPQDRLKQAFLWGRKQLYREFWALRDVSFYVRQGEMLGIIGRNGAGKSTLLQILAGTLPPTVGEVQVNGRVAALLELGSGFNPDFTGRENIYLNGAILGFSRQAMDERFDEIAAFADIGDFIEQPVKLYSSGMYVRLAFAVQACAEPDVLIVDEALAVGDIFFRQKCYQRLENLREQGVSIILATHSMADVEQYCQRALLLDRGKTLAMGSAAETVKRYYLVEQESRTLARSAPSNLRSSTPVQSVASVEESDSFWPAAEDLLDISDMPQVSNGWARCVAVGVCNSDGQRCHVFQQGETASFFYEFELLQDIEVPIGGLVIRNEKGVNVHGKNTLQYETEVPIQVSKGSRLRFRQDITLEIALGDYTFTLGLSAISSCDYERRMEYSNAELNAKIFRICHLSSLGPFTVTIRQNSSRVHLLHHGVANLPGKCFVTVR